MTNRPIKYPEWATQGRIDPATGENNIIEPPSEKITDGVIAGEYLPAAWFNYLNNSYCEWIAYIDERLNKPEIYTVATLPSPTTNKSKMIYVDDEAGGAVIAFSDGTNWRRLTDREIVS